MTITDLNNISIGTLGEHLGIVFTEMNDGELKATMPVDQRTIQPMKLLHGGAIMALAETIGSAGSMALVDSTKFNVVGIEINGNHVSNTNEKMVWAEAKIVHKGGKIHVWDIRIMNSKRKLISICRLTNMILPKQK